MSKNNTILTLVIIFWLAAIGLGFSFILRHQFKANSNHSILKTWPTDSKLKLDHKLNTLLIFVHPHCPCSRASLAELNRLLTSYHNKVHTIVIFSKPKGKDDNWLKSDLWTKAQSLPGASIYVDNNNREAKVFRTNTSGEILLFNTDGRLVYHGGITDSRGHEGDSRGKSLISNYLKSGTLPQEDGEAFGCTL